MPIRPENASRYPSTWALISRIVKILAGWQCECEGECGRGHRGRCSAIHGGWTDTGTARVVLTTAHLDHQPENCDGSNLKAMCQGCHLHYDIEHHRQSKLERERRDRAEAGQLEMVA